MDKEFSDKIKKDLVYAIIPARSGSKGVKDKNIKTVAGYPLISFSIAAAALCPYVEKIIVSTDSERYAKIANYYGAETPFLRPAEISKDSSPDIEFMDHCISWMAENESVMPEYFVHLRSTTPLREMDVVNSAVKTILDAPSATSLRSVHPAPGTPQKWVVIGDDGFYQPIIHGMTMDDVNKPRQAFETVYIPDGYVDVLKTEYIYINKRMHGDLVKSFIVPESVDVDAVSDLNQVNEILELQGHPILEYLRNNFKTLDEVEL